MSTQIGLYQPLNTLKPIDENIWIVDGSEIKFSELGMKIPFSTRMVIVRLGNGDLFLWSPIAINENLKTEIDRLGVVKHLISPNKIHYAFIADWKAAYPDAIAWASPGVRDRAKSQNIDVDFDADLKDVPEPDWADEIDQMIFQGGRFMAEIVFFHKSSRTLILADLIENFELDKVPPRWRILFNLSGTVAPDGKMPIDLRLTYIGHKNIARQSFKRMMKWQPQRITIAHGRCYFENAEDELYRAFRWLNVKKPDR
ncbi:MAG: DUF4336 domain-containing protein [Pleurocapsa sp.]